MRILHVVSNISIRNGIMVVLMNYFRNIKDDNVMFSFLYYNETEESFEKEILKLGGEIYKLNKRTFLRDWEQFCCDNFGKFDILHNHELYLSLIVNNSKRKLGNKIIISHAHATRFSDSRYKELRNKVLSLLSRKSDYLLACSKVAGESLFSKHFLTKGYILKNAIEVSKYQFNVEMRAQIRDRYAIKDKIVIGHVGNFSIPKNHTFLLKVFSELLELKANAILLLIGEGCLRGQIEEEAIQLGIKDKIIFIGATDKVEEYLCAMDVYVFPSLFEGLGIALVEAQSNGLPCIYSDAIPKEADILRENNISMSLNESPKLWAERIIGLEMSRYPIGDEIEKSGYDISKEVLKLVQFYQDVLEGRKTVSL